MKTPVDSSQPHASASAPDASADLERLFNLSLDLMVVSSVDGYFKRVNPAVTEILGWSPAEFLAQPYLDLVHPEDRPATAAEVERQVSTGAKVLRFDNRYRHKDGSWRVLSWRSVPQPGGLMFATARDVTEARRAEAEIRRLNAELLLQARQLTAAGKELESFSYSISHDLRAPLRHVQGYVELLKRELKEPLSDRAQHYIQTVSRASSEMSSLIEALLAFSRLGRAEMSETRVELQRLVEESRTRFDTVSAGRRIEWRIDPLPAVRGDLGMLRQVVTNLLDNAVKFTRGRDPARIDIACEGEREGQLVFRVRDNGAGFDLRQADKLFGVFQRFHRVEDFEGTGMGLANVRRLIARHGGRTWAESAPDAGATIYFTLNPAAPG